MSGKPKAIVIGTGFGGAVTAHRLVNNGFDVVVLERGRRFRGNDFPSLPEAHEVFPDFARWGWESSVIAAEANEKHAVDLTEQLMAARVAKLPPRPKIPAPPRHSGPSHWSMAQGLWDVRDMGGVISAHAAGYGGGSLVYANVHLRAPEKVFASGWPSALSRAALEPYYDRVATKLAINPITVSPERDKLPKTVQLTKAAAALKRTTFYPPLAIHFGPDRPNGAGGVQKGCTLCGECDTGCRTGAKNTLDQNYLVDVDAGADVRTLAEVLWIAPIAPTEANEANEANEASDARIDGYAVTYFDHTVGEQRTETAKYVFVCAGSVCSTEILLRSKARGLALSESLGSHFYANADSLAIAFDTDEPHEPSRGPTITTALVHEDADPNGPWFMIQDGGYPQALTRAIGTFRARALLGRNAYPSPRDAHPDPVDPFRSEAGPKRKAPFRAFPDGLFWILKNGDLSKGSDGIVPPDFSGGLKDLLREARAVGRQELSEIVPAVTGEMRAHAVDRILKRLHLQRLGWLRAALLDVAKWLQPHLGADDETLIEISQRLLVERYAPTLDNAARIGAWMLNWETNPTRPTHRAVLLGMGRDDQPGHYYFDASGRMQVRLKLNPQAQTYSQQELLMRDLAAQWQAELRVNPTWAGARRPVTVHHQGGCPMADEARHGVVDGWGKAHGQDGLFVFDGAALPRAVGVNPSSTIAALAERNVQRFLETCGEAGVTWSLGAREQAEIAAWRLKSQSWDLEPPKGSTAATKSERIGVVFNETMTGFHSPWPVVLPPPSVAAPLSTGPLSTGPLSTGAPLSARSQREAKEYKDLFSELDPSRPHRSNIRVSAEAKDYEAAYRAGCPGNSIALTLTGTVADIVAFDADDQHRLTLGGTVELHWPEQGIQCKAPASGHANFFVPMTFARYTGPDRIMLYDLHFKDDSGDPWHLLGFKRMHAGEGTRAWADTTNLFVTVSRVATGKELSTMGVARLSMERFLYDVLGKMHVTGTTDPGRKTWAMAIYGEVLFGHLWDIYLPGILRSKSLVASRPLSRRT